MSSRRILALLNRGVRVASSFLPSSDKQTTTTQMDRSPNDPDVPARGPVQELADQLAVMEQLLADLSLRLPINQPPSEPAAPVAPVPQVPEAPYGMTISNRR
jgi:hypothetical protein